MIEVDIAEILIHRDRIELRLFQNILFQNINQDSLLTQWSRYKEPSFLFSGNLTLPHNEQHAPINEGFLILEVAIVHGMQFREGRCHMKAESSSDSAHTSELLQLAAMSVLKLSHILALK